MWQEQVLEIRCFEESLLELHKEGLISGTVHTCVGQELVAISVGRCLNNNVDAIFATHRGHGYYISYGGDTVALLAEMTGRSGALCLGRGGSQHLNFKNFFSNGIQGAGAVQAVGYAWGQKRKNNGGVTIVQLGDGTFGQGSVYESFNFTKLLKVPILFVVEVNGWAQSTEVSKTILGSIEDRVSGFGISYTRISDKNPEELFKKVEVIVGDVRSGKPHVLIVETQRLLAHSKGDDDRDPDFLKEQFNTDPLLVWGKENKEDFDNLEQKFKNRYSLEILDIKSRSLVTDIGISSLRPLITSVESQHITNNNESSTIRFVETLNNTFHKLFSKHEDTFMIGEDLKDPYGGAFKVCRGLSDKFEDRIFSTPIAENAIVGVTVGLALSGYRPIAEIMFADFVTLAADQIINSAAKFYYMFGEKVNCPVIIRLVSGGGRGYGPTHSQNLENLFCGVPGLRIIAVSEYHNIDSLYEVIYDLDRAPVIIVEDKRMYGRFYRINLPVLMEQVNVRGDLFNIPSLVFKPKGIDSVLTVVCYGQMASLVEETINKLLYEEEIFVDLVVVTQIYPLDISSIKDSVTRTKRVLVVDQNQGTYSFAGAVISELALAGVICGFSSKVVSAKDYPNPSSVQLENKVLPSADNVFQAALDLVKI